MDRYREGHRYYVLISLRETKNRGDLEEFLIERTIHGGFTNSVEDFQVDIDHRTRQFSMGLVFPPKRLPRQVTLIEQNATRAISLNGEHRRQLPDGRLEFRWKTHHPRLFETYILRWQW